MLLALDPLLEGRLLWTPLLIVLGKVVFIFVVGLVSTMFMVWYERKVVSGMHNRVGPNKAGPWGILQSLADVSPLAGKLGWLAAFVYIACAALRLARFNAQAGGEAVPVSASTAEILAMSRRYAALTGGASAVLAPASGVIGLPPAPPSSRRAAWSRNRPYMARIALEPQ